ncbi:class E sortase [Kitasatospora purpeofusca]|uniref:class E sortase n=1 Tax=Kitasatospora purpeofusca TaxID=67352 RepID=UPI002258148A|nr:class E sortase [Kitasatospora purpeofusca]MCX4686741.1 class E sortase [Kitasatospora purpeofusca]
MTAVRPEGRYQPGADPEGGDAYRVPGPFEQHPGPYGQQQDPYGQQYPQGGPSPSVPQQYPQGGAGPYPPQGAYPQQDQYGQYGQQPQPGQPGQPGQYGQQGQQPQSGQQGQQGQYQSYDPYQAEPVQHGRGRDGNSGANRAWPTQPGAEDGWGVYEQAAPPVEPLSAEAVLTAPSAPDPAGTVLAAAETVTMAAVAGDRQPPAPGGRAERRRAAQGHGRRRAGGRAAAGPRAKEPAAVVFARFLGELCITLGLVMLLFVSYQLWWTNVQADAAADGARNRLEQQFDAGPAQGAPAPGQPAPDPAKPETFEPGKGFAIIHLPKLGQKFPIAEGTAKAPVLDKGLVGHYTGTGMPADKAGNFALAAHRNTHGEPFRRINQLGKGDKIVVETATAYYTYEVTGGIPETPPSNVSVIKSVPNGAGFSGPGRYITLTTCTPEFSSKARLIVFGKMIEEKPRSQGKPAALAGG